MTPAPTNDLKALMALVDETDAALKKVSLDQLTGSAKAFAQYELATFQGKLLEMREFAGDLQRFGKESDIAEVADFRRKLATILKDVKTFKKRYGLRFRIPRLWPRWQFWK